MFFLLQFTRFRMVQCRRTSRQREAALCPPIAGGTWQREKEPQFFKPTLIGKASAYSHVVFLCRRNTCELEKQKYIQPSTEIL